MVDPSQRRSASVPRACAPLLALIALAALGLPPLWSDPRADLSYLISRHAAAEPAVAPGSSGLRAAAGRFAGAAAETTNEMELALHALLFLYQAFVSTQDRPSCMYSPTCSEYARMAIRRYGILRGILMASDRLQRCNGFPSQSYPLDASGRRLDPP